ncbi:N-acetylmuramoyl-L-alanine amidase [Plantactinospora sp. WMMB782]|uniref:peptidoglycan recognition protein family protein n=1 Tax=Plantactinospora sp. WMMB782 TaxID=3404121 RepID=UPI003B961839
MALTWLADELRKAGLTVVEHSNWKTHDRPGSWSPTFGVVHATAAPRSQKDSVQIGVVRNGRSDLPGPIANAVIDRDGVWHLVSAGRCNSTLAGTAGPYKGKGNTYALSTEACNDNRGEPWTEKQYRSYVRGWAAWCRRLGWSANRLVGHKEHTPGRKTDPTFSMSQFRADVAAVLDGKDDDMPYSESELRALPWQYAGRGMPGVPEGRSTLWTLGSIYSATQALLRAQVGDGADEIIAEIRAQGDRTRAALIELRDAILAELPESGPVSRADVEAAFRAVLGSVDGATPDGK